MTLYTCRKFKLSSYKPDISSHTHGFSQQYSLLLNHSKWQKSYAHLYFWNHLCQGVMLPGLVLLYFCGFRVCLCYFPGLGLGMVYFALSSCLNFIFFFKNLVSMCVSFASSCMPFHCDLLPRPYCFPVFPHPFPLYIKHVLLFFSAAIFAVFCNPFFWCRWTTVRYLSINLLLTVYKIL